MREIERQDITLIIALKKDAFLEEIIQLIGTPKHLPSKLFVLEKFQIFKFPELFKSEEISDTMDELLSEHSWVSKRAWIKKVEDYNYIKNLLFKNKIKIDRITDDYFILTQDIWFVYDYFYEAYIDMVNKIEAYEGDELKFILDAIYYGEGYGRVSVNEVF